MDTSNHLYGVQLKRWHPPYLKCASLVLLSDYMVFIKEDIDLFKKKREYHFAKWRHNCNFKEVYISLVIPNFRPPTMMLATNGLCLRVKEFIFETEICEANFLLPTIEVDNDIYIYSVCDQNN